MNPAGDIEANTLLDSLTTGLDFSVPAVDFSAPEFQTPDLGDLPSPTQLTNDALTTGAIDGTGIFDKFMGGVKAQLREEFDAGRITGDQYAKAHIALAEAVIAQSVQFLLNRDQTYWQALGARYQAETLAIQSVTARVELEVAKAKLQATRAEALLNESNFALTKLKLATEEANYEIANYNLTTMLPAQKLIADAQKTLVTEQGEAQHAQTSDKRLDGVTAITGLIGSQKLLYAQQVTSYKRDAEVKAAKLFTDSWITQKTIDEGLLPPTKFANASLDDILSTLKNNLQLDGGTHI